MAVNTERRIGAGAPGVEASEVRAVRTGGTTGWVVSWVLVLGLALAAAILFLISLGESGTGVESLQDRQQAGFFGAGCMAAGLLMLTFIGGRRGGGIFSPLIGADGRASTSLTQIGLWTVLISGGVAYLLGLTIFDASRTVENVLPPRIWDDYLILLGGPFSAGVLAKGIVTYKVREGTLQKSEPQAASVQQLAQGDNGEPDLVDSQYLLFNVIAMAYYVANVFSDGSMPVIPGFLLAITSGTAALYVANKAAARNAPTITSISPAAVSPGKELTIYGTNFDPGDPTYLARRITVSLDRYDEVIYSDDSSDTEVTVRIPTTVEVGWSKVVVTSTAGVETVARDLKIIDAHQNPPATTHTSGRQTGGVGGQAPKRKGWKVTGLQDETSGPRIGR